MYACTICTYLEGCCLRCCFHAVSSCCFNQLLQLLQVQRLTQPLRVICNTTATATMLRQPTDVNTTTQHLDHTSCIKTWLIWHASNTPSSMHMQAQMPPVASCNRTPQYAQSPGDTVGTWRPHVTLFQTMLSAWCSSSCTIPTFVPEMQTAPTFAQQPLLPLSLSNGP